MITQTTKHAELSAGRLRYQVAGDGPPIVFVHGLLNDGALWRKVVSGLAKDFKCVTVDWPLGSHKEPMKPSADLSPPGVAKLIAEFLEALDLREVTLVGNDTGGALVQMVMAERPERVARVVLTPSDAFDNFLPALFRPLQMLARRPRLLAMQFAPLRLRPLRRLPIAFGWLSKRAVPADVSDEWLRPFFTNPDVRRDVCRFLAAIDSQQTQDAAAKLPGLDRPVLIAWAPEDRFFPLEHAHKLAELLPDARVEEIPDSYTYVPEDQPERLAELIAAFMREPARVPSG